jgi:hypothetical protein
MELLSLRLCVCLKHPHVKSQVACRARCHFAVVFMRPGCPVLIMHHNDTSTQLTVGYEDAVTNSPRLHLRNFSYKTFKIKSVMSIFFIFTLTLPRL